MTLPLWLNDKNMDSKLTSTINKQNEETTQTMAFSKESSLPAFLAPKEL